MSTWDGYIDLDETPFDDGYEAEDHRETIDNCQNCGALTCTTGGRYLCTLCERRLGSRAWDLGDIA